MEKEDESAETNAGNELEPICGNDRDFNFHHVLLDVSAHILT